MALIRDKKQRTITSRKTAPLFVCAQTVRPHMNISDGLTDKEAAP
jgi:hypothetical protein